VLTGDSKAGAVYFNGEGKCSTCHSPTGDLAKIGSRMDPPTLQQRFSVPGGRGGARGTRCSAGDSGDRDRDAGIGSGDYGRAGYT
jgi:mono/diheme cytochrome c family protein